MVFVDSITIDGGKRIGLGLGLGLGMEELEVEEGEAHRCHDGDGDSTIDPDIALSYIGEKLQTVLGHFQKDFEGGVSAENLGAKFGGYGSFLPSYQRSPSWSHTRSPAEVHNYDSPRSPVKLHLEDQRRSSFAPLSSSPSARSCTASGKVTPLGNSLKTKHKHAKKSNIKSGFVKPVNPPAQRTLKVRIKVGSENFLTLKNAEIYSGLGLVVSPLSSLDDCPATSAGQCHNKVLCAPEESPTSILEIMTSDAGGLLLSPLSEDLICLTKRRKPRKKCEDKSLAKIDMKNSVILGNESLARSNHRVLEHRKLKSYEKDGTFSTGSANHNNSDKGNVFSQLKKDDETVIDISGCEELASNAMEFPLVLSAQYTLTELPKYGVKAENLSAEMTKENSTSESAHDIHKCENLRGADGSVGGASGLKKGDFSNNTTAFAQEDALKGEDSHDLDKNESNATKGKSLSASGCYDSSKQFVKKRALVSEGSRKPTPEQLSATSKGKQKVAHSINDQCGTSSHNIVLVPKNNSPGLQKDSEKPDDRDKDIFGDVEFENEFNGPVSGEMTSSGMLKEPDFFAKKNLSKHNSLLNEECNNEEPHPVEASATRGPHMPSSFGNRPRSEAPTGMTPMVSEHWVKCDKCHKQRLLPLVTNPNSLPNKWICRMLNWLPGMNRCSVPEDETTKALRALYSPATLVPLPASEGQGTQVNNPVRVSSGMASVDARYAEQGYHTTAVQTATAGGKKKHGSTKSANSTDFGGSTHSSESLKRDLTTSEKACKLSSSLSPSLGTSRYQHISAVEKYANKNMEKLSLVNSSSKDTNLKKNSEREGGVEGSKASKRIKNKELHYDEERTSNNGETPSEACCGSTSLSISTSGDTHKVLRDEEKKNSLSGVRAEIYVPGARKDGGNHDKDTVRKRKSTEAHGSQIDNKPSSSAGHHLSKSGGAMEEMCESDLRKDKKARVSKSGEKDSSGSQTSIEPDRRSQGTWGDRQAVPAQPSVAMNSSSSKVSGSHKRKYSGKEIKGSPVESVSSSPLRFSNADRVASSRKNLVDKDDFPDSSPVRHLDGEGDRGNDESGMVNENTLTVDHHVTDVDVEHHSKQCRAEDKTNTSHFYNSEVHLKESAKEISKDKPHASGSDLDKVDVKVRVQKYAARGTSSESSKGRSWKNFQHDEKAAPEIQDKNHGYKEHGNEKFSNKNNKAKISGSGKPHQIPPLARVQIEAVSSPQTDSGSQKENAPKTMVVGAFDNGDAPKEPNQRKGAENPSSIPIRQPTPNSHKVRGAEAPSPLRRDSSSNAANNALKEAKGLKHLADRLKNSASGESIGYYFQAALKFLHGASLLESGSSEATKKNELAHSMHIYSSTAKLCEFCAREYEKLKDMAGAALAYKCMEVAYLRVVYSSHTRASRDRNELQTALQISNSGESPSSSASDVDNQAIADKSALVKVSGNCPQVTMISSQNRHGFLRILEFAQSINFAMEASRKSRIALTAATGRLGKTSRRESVSSLKNAVDFNYQDVETLLRLVRVAMER